MTTLIPTAVSTELTISSGLALLIQNASKSEIKGAPPIELIALIQKTNIAVLALEQLLHDKQAQTSALATPFRRDERLKNSVFDLGINTAAIICEEYIRFF